MRGFIRRLGEFLRTIGGFPASHEAVIRIQDDIVHEQLTVRVLAETTEVTLEHPKTVGPIWDDFVKVVDSQRKEMFVLTALAKIDHKVFWRSLTTNLLSLFCFMYVFGVCWLVLIEFLWLPLVTLLHPWQMRF